MPVPEPHLQAAPETDPRDVFRDATDTASPQTQRVFLLKVPTSINLFFILMDIMLITFMTFILLAVVLNCAGCAVLTSRLHEAARPSLTR